ncbi:MtnX-like HAD-IB family phosphatase [Alicyclobacillus fastidiosus]|uniref:MtnX-like HAD-IB family phosphatase n=1 Tax=Alicyclobacillus fastidiosus TaxID=392011 RepID=A0ABV5AEA4_9BACL|nr:MtnX-like HAD-IB family phosphatase [Alicyclobacillus fastidiosus]WEH11948.1 MtnX-like HAD-IB family phosphatase [Alicyclobacillus fastidiosus]
MHVICDFDGTIAEKDMIAAIMREFVPREAEPIIQDVYRGNKSIRVGVEEMFRLLPSARFEDVAAFAKANTIVRPGFQQFIHTCGQLGWKVAVVSGGFDFFVHPVIHSLSTAVDIYCNRLNLTGPRCEVEWAVSCDATCEGGCGLCKPSVMRSLDDGQTSFIVIGDGVTDFKAAQEANYVFARASLLELVRERGIPASPFDTFYDVDDVIQDGGSSLYDYI